MNSQELLAFSAKLNELILGARDLLQLHSARYKHLVDNSPRGTDCTYAQITMRLHNENPDETILALTKLGSQTQELLTWIQKPEEPQNT